MLREELENSCVSFLLLFFFFFFAFVCFIRDTLEASRPTRVFRFVLYAGTTLYYRYRHHRGAVLTSKPDVHVVALLFHTRLVVVVISATFDTIARRIPNTTLR